MMISFLFAKFPFRDKPMINFIQGVPTDTDVVRAVVIASRDLGVIKGNPRARPHSITS